MTSPHHPTLEVFQNQYNLLQKMNHGKAGIPEVFIYFSATTLQQKFKPENIYNFIYKTIIFIYQSKQAGDK